MSEKKIVFVNCTAITSGGGLTILRQFLDNIKKAKEKNILYYIFSSIDLSEFHTENIIIVNDIKGRRWRDRLIWDFYGIKKWSLRHEVKPSIIISLQNTGVLFNKTPQIIYLHQSIPFYDIKWNILSKTERRYWFYKNIYDKIIRFTINRNTKIVVQSDWMKAKVCKKFNIREDRVFSIKPDFINIDTDKIENIELDSSYYHIFYPASGHKYKNHKVLIEALGSIKKNNLDIYNKINIHLTLNKDSNRDLYKLIKKYDVEDSIIFEGKLKFDEVLKFYKTCDLVVFPSYLETIGLPLIESAQFGCKIICTDAAYTRDVIFGYEGVTFIHKNDVKSWANNISESVNKRIKYNKYETKFSTGWNDFIKLIYKDVIER